MASCTASSGSRSDEGALLSPQHREGYSTDDCALCTLIQLYNKASFPHSAHSSSAGGASGWPRRICSRASISEGVQDEGSSRARVTHLLDVAVAQGRVGEEGAHEADDLLRRKIDEVAVVEQE